MHANFQLPGQYESNVSGVGGWVGGWPESDNMTISVQLNLIGTGTGTELGNIRASGCISGRIVGC